MATLSPPKTIAVTACILAVICAPLLAGSRRTGRRRSSHSDKAKIEQSPQKSSRAASSPKANIVKSPRSRGKSSVSRNPGPRRQRTTAGRRRNAGKAKRRSTPAPSKPATAPAKITSTRKKSPTPPSSTIKITEKSKPDTFVASTSPAFVRHSPLRSGINRLRSGIQRLTTRTNRRQRLITPIKGTEPKNYTSPDKSFHPAPASDGKGRHSAPADRHIDRPAGHRHIGEILKRHGLRRRHKRFPEVAFQERSRAERRFRRHEHVYRDYRGLLHHRIVRPGYRFAVYYRGWPGFTFRYFYPYYHRKYVFVSLGGYWPLYYSYARYYWYPCHPYYWYGYYPIAREVQGDTYNYYTYNYYTEDIAAPTEAANAIRPVDHTTFADVRERQALEAARQPSPETRADSLFEEAVNAFEAYDYDSAAEKFAEAITLEPDDIVMPFAYAQALFAAEKYFPAADALRRALAKVPPQEDGVFYPRGLYPDDEILFDQIEKLTEQADPDSPVTDLQLLLGYQLLGTGEIDRAEEQLRLAVEDPENADAARILLDLLEKIQAGTDENTGR